MRTRRVPAHRAPRQPNLLRGFVQLMVILVVVEVIALATVEYWPF